MREDWIDRWRGILMISIVAFHVIGAIAFCCSGEAETAITFCKNRLAMFHTKGFFVISGILWRTGESFGDFAMRKAKRLLVPYFVFGFAWALLFVFLSRYFPYFNSGELTFWQPFLSVLLADGWPEGIGFRVINALWFLPCLFLVEIFYYWIARFIPNTRRQLALLPVCFALDGLISKPDIFWGLNLVPRFLIFFYYWQGLPE
ncbi:MAG: acyltransferase family protein [Kiritimatiellia bacterium]